MEEMSPTLRNGHFYPNKQAPKKKTLAGKADAFANEYCILFKKWKQNQTLIPMKHKKNRSIVKVARFHDFFHGIFFNNT